MLVVDDEPQLLELLCLTLQINGYAVDAAPDGPRALALARTHTFDVAILDVVMSPWSGFDTAERLRELPQSPRILFLTGLHDQASTERGLELGEAYLTKPFRPAELLARLRAITAPSPDRSGRA